MKKLVETLDLQRDLGRNPLFQVLFAVQSSPPGELALPGITTELLSVDRGYAQLDLSLTLVTGKPGLAGRLEYNRDLFDHETVVAFAGHFIRLMDLLIDQPELPVARVDYLAGPERETLLNAWNDNHVDHPEELIHQRFAHWARKTPDATALLVADASGETLQNWSLHQG